MLSMLASLQLLSLVALFNTRVGFIPSIDFSLHPNLTSRKKLKLTT
jgi:hypothetical protein